MISILYWIVTIILSYVFESWTLFFVLIGIWIIWMLVRAAGKNGFGTDSGDSWWFFDFDSGGGSDGFDGFGGGEFGGGGAGGDWDIDIDIDV